MASRLLTQIKHKHVLVGYEAVTREHNGVLPRHHKRGRSAAPGSSLAKARHAAHRAFDPIWEDGEMTRSAAYSWLARQLNLRPRDCHMILFDEATCARVIGICNAHRFKRKLGLDLV